MYTFYSDPGHGWLKVDRQELIDLGIAESISPYSYQNRQDVYLEEDSDLTKFFNAYVEKNGVKPELTEVYQERTPIRNYDRYTPPAPAYDMVDTGEACPQYTFDTAPNAQLSLF
jgi:hypothetical protein